MVVALLADVTVVSREDETIRVYAGQIRGTTSLGRRWCSGPLVGRL